MSVYSGFLWHYVCTSVCLVHWLYSTWQKFVYNCWSLQCEQSVMGFVLNMHSEDYTLRDHVLWVMFVIAKVPGTQQILSFGVHCLRKIRTSINEPYMIKVNSRFLKNLNNKTKRSLDSFHDFFILILFWD